MTESLTRSELVLKGQQKENMYKTNLNLTYYDYKDKQGYYTVMIDTHFTIYFNNFKPIINFFQLITYSEKKL